GGGREIRRVTYAYFKGWLAKRYFEETGEVVGREPRENAVHLLQAKAIHGGKRHRLSERFARTPEGAIWIDLGNEKWNAVCVTAKGWEVEKRPPILFRRHEHMTALPEPVPGGTLFDVFRFLNVSDKADQLLVLAW